MTLIIALTISTFLGVGATAAFTDIAPATAPTQIPTDSMMAINATITATTNPAATTIQHNAFTSQDPAVTTVAIDNPASTATDQLNYSRILAACAATTTAATAIETEPGDVYVAGTRTMAVSTPANNNSLHAVAKSTPAESIRAHLTTVIACKTIGAPASLAA